MKAYELLEKPERWTRRAFARDRYGAAVWEHSADAAAWCMLGAVYRCYPVPQAHHDVRARLGCRLSDCDSGVVGWNDSPVRTHAEVVALLRELDI